MAQVTHTKQTQSDIDHHLEYQFQAWSGIPDIAEEWSEMDASQREAFHLEWVGITESRLRTLQEWVARDLLTAKQCTRYAELLAVIVRYRPTVDDLLTH